MRWNEVVGAGLACVIVASAAPVSAGPPRPGNSKDAQVQPVGAAASALRPDLVVEKIWVAGTHSSPGGGTRVDVRYTVANLSMVDSWKTPTAAGTMFWFDHLALNQQVCSAVDMRVLPNGFLPPVPEGIECLNRLGAGARVTCSGAVDVPAGSQVEIRATVDPRNWVNERSEANNSKSLTWPPPAASPIAR